MEESTERAPLVAQKIDSLAKLLFNKSIMGSGKSSPADTPASSPSKSGEKSMESSAALAICTDYLANTPRYELIAPLGQIGFRANKHWFAIHDHTIKTDRLLTLVPLPRSCGLAGGAGAGAEAERRGALLELLRALQHPYLLPVLELALSAAHALAVLPFNPGGSLKDLIYGSVWNEEYGRKYVVAKALPAWQVARFGRQLLEGLLFLHDKGFPPFRHLHTGNVMVQNGVARISGVESTLTGLAGRGPAAAAPQLGAVLLEMCACSRADTPFLPDAYQPVVEIVDVIFGPRGAASGAGGGGAAGGAWGAGLAELLMCDAFRKIDLREMKGSCLPNFNQRLSRSCLSLLESVSRRGAAPATPPPRIRHAATPPARRRHYNMEQDFTEEWGW